MADGGSVLTLTGRFVFDKSGWTSGLQEARQELAQFGAAGATAVAQIEPAAESAAAALSQATNAQQALSAATAPVAASAGAAEAALQAQTQAANENTRALTEATAALRAFVAAQDGAGKSVPETVPPLSAQARALRDIVEAADPAVRQARLMTEAEEVLNRAVKEGTITQERAAEVLRKYGESHTVATAAGSRFGAMAQQAGYQIGDFAVQVSSGQSALVAFAQQGSQILGIFGVWGAVAGAAVAIFAGLANGMGLFEDATTSSDEALRIHEQNLKKWTDTGDLAKQKADQLAYSFAGMSGAAREAAALDFQERITKQLGAIDQAAKQAIDELGKVGVAFDKAYSVPVGEFGDSFVFPARVRLDLDVQIPPDLDAKIQNLLKPLFEGNRDQTFLASLHRDLESLAEETDGDARKAIEAIASSVSRLSRDAQNGSKEIRLLEALMRSARGSADDLDREVIDAAIAIGQLGSAFGRSADMVDRLVRSIDGYLKMPLTRTMIDQAEGFGSDFMQWFRAQQARAEIQGMIDNANADAAAYAGGQAAQRARERQKFVDAAVQKAADTAMRGGLIFGEDQREAVRSSAGNEYDQKMAAADRKAAERAAKRQNDLDREIERVQKATADMRTQGDVIGLTTEQAAKLEAQNRLLLAADQAQVKVTAEKRAEIDKLADAYAKEAARVHELETAERRRQRLVGDSISLIGETATPEEQRARDITRLGQMRSALQSPDPQTLERLAEAGYSVADAQEAIERQLVRLNNPELFAFADEAKASLRELAQTIIADFSQAGDVLVNFGNRLAEIGIQKFLIDPLVDGAEGLLGDLAGDLGLTGSASSSGKTGGIGGLLGSLFGSEEPGDKALASADFAVATATINVAGGAIAGDGGLAGALAGGLLPDRPDATLDRLAGDLAGDKLQGGAGTDLLDSAVGQVGDALNGVADGVREQGSGFLGSFGGALGSIINGFSSLFSGDVGKGAGGILSGLLTFAGSFLGFRNGGSFLGGVQAFASGASMRGGAVVDVPTLFPMAGGKMGIFSETLDAEAIMPTVQNGRAIRGRRRDGRELPLHLTRLPSGMLGVMLPDAAQPFARGGSFAGGASMELPWTSGGAANDQRGAAGITMHIHGVQDADSFRRSRGQIMAAYGAELQRQLRRNGGG